MTAQATGVTAPTLVSHDPATDEVVATFPIDGEEDVRAAVERARAAYTWWRDQGFTAGTISTPHSRVSDLRIMNNDQRDRGDSSLPYRNP